MHSEKPVMCSTAWIRSFANIALETVLMFICLMMEHPRPFKKDRLVLPLSTPLGFVPPGSVSSYSTLHIFQSFFRCLAFTPQCPLKLHLSNVTGIQHNLWWGAWMSHPLSAWCWNRFSSDLSMHTQTADGMNFTPRHRQQISIQAANKPQISIQATNRQAINRFSFKPQTATYLQSSHRHPTDFHSSHKQTSHISAVKSHTPQTDFHSSHKQTSHIFAVKPQTSHQQIFIQGTNSWATDFHSSHKQISVQATNRFLTHFAVTSLR